jgi:class 3 adenylate cyclase
VSNQQPARHFGQSPERLGPDQIRAYQLYLADERRLAPKSTIAASRFLYHVTSGREWDPAQVLPIPQRTKTLPIVLSPDEVVRFLDSVHLPNHRTILTTCYAAGLRVSEAIHLTVPAIDSRRMVRRVGRRRTSARIRWWFSSELPRVRQAPMSDHDRRPTPGDGAPREVLEGSEATVYTTFAATTQAPDLPAAFGRYEVRGVRGSGGFGTVYTGYDPSLDREVAIKVPSGPLSERSAAKQFLAEARNLARLRHPCIVTVFDVGVEDDRCFIVSELLDGTPLHEWLKRRRPDWREVADIAARLAEALGHAHEYAVVHRDVKPGNVVLTRDRGPVLVDFGLAITDRARPSELGTFRGTPSFMSPEQVGGRAHRIDGRTDIYSLGVTLYLMLCGRLPFRAPSVDELVRQILDDEPQPPRQIVPALPPEIERICLTAMAKVDRARYTAAHDLARELRALLDDPAAAERARDVGPGHAPAGDARASMLTPVRPKVQRRHLTFLMITGDPVGPTDDPDVDDRAELDAAFKQQCTEVASLYSGTILHSGGSSLVLCFGYPVAQEDAARRAVNTCLDLQALFGSSAPATRGGSWRYWLSVHAGTVVVHDTGTGAPEITGEALTVVTRLESVTPPGQIIVTRDIRGLVSRFFRLEPAGQPLVRGVREPVEIFRVLGPMALGEPDLPEGVTQTPLVGRTQEVGLLFDRWALTREGLGQAVMLAGDAGLGKSRLVRSLREHLASHGDSSVVEWRCSPAHTNSALHPATDGWERMLGFLPGDGPADRLATLKAYLRQLDLPLSEGVPLIGAILELPDDDEYPLPALSPQRQKELTGEWIAAWLGALARRSPLLFIVEDLHWVDPSTLDLLTGLVDDPLPDPIMCVFTFRPEFVVPWKSRRVTQMALNRLSRSQVGEMIRGQTGLGALPDSLMQRVAERTDGVPLFVEELMKAIAEAGISGRSETFDHSHASRELSTDWSRITVPDSLQDLLMARLDRIGGNPAVVQVAAAIGREFRPDLLAAASGVQEDELADALERLVQAELVHRHGRPPAAAYIFKHALIRDAAYESMVRKDRARVHASIAAALESRWPDVIAREPETQAYHLTEAGLFDTAIDYWQRAGSRAIQRSSYPEAFVHLTRGMDLLRQLPETPERDRKEYLLNVPLGIASLSLRGYASPELGDLYERRYQLCEQIADDMGRLHALWALASWRIVRSEQDIARDIGDRMERLADQIDDEGARMEAGFIRQIVAFYRGELEEAARAGAETMARYEPERCLWHTARLGQHAGVAALAYLAVTEWCLGRPETAFATMARALEMTASLDHPFTDAFVLYNSALLHKACRLGREAHQDGERQIAVARERGFSFWETTGHLYRASGLVELGRFEEARAQLVEWLARFQAHGANLGLPFYRAYLAEACLGLGDLDGAQRALDAATAAIEASNERFYEPEVIRLQGLLAIARGDDALGREHLEHASALSRRQHARAWELRATLALSQWLARHGQAAEGHSRLDRIYRQFDEGLSTPDLLAAAAQLRALEQAAG